VDAFFEVPTEPGAYWYWCEKRQAFRVCEVVEKDGHFKARFTDGSIQGWCGDKSYFVGPIHEPVIGPGGTISSS
jgi:hypothetical protein